MDRLNSDEQLVVNGELDSDNGRVRAVLQADGNLVVYRTDDGRALWASGTDGAPVSHVIMQDDGNLVAYGADQTPYWASGTDGHPGAFVVMQDDGNLVIYDGAARALWASDTVQRFGPVVVGGFLPSTRAPLFHNGPWPPSTSLSASIAGLPAIGLNVTHMGLCGGMSFLARDIFESGTPQLQNRVADRIPAKLAQHLLSRLLNSFSGPGVVARWLALTRALDHDTAVWGAGLFRQTLEQILAILDDIDAGTLCPIGLVLAHSYAPWEVFSNHVVLVWGYERHGDVLTLRTYDCNFQGRDDIVIELDISSPTPAKTITTNGTSGPTPGQIRGFFRLPYTHTDPSPAYIDDAVVAVAAPPTPTNPGATVAVRVTAANTGSTTWTPAGGYRLGSQDPQDNLTWGTNRVELAQPTVDPGQTATFDFTVTIPDGPDTYLFSWQMVREHVHWFGHASPSVPVAVGSHSEA
jgi:hypothetical protein